MVPTRKSHTKRVVLPKEKAAGARQNVLNNLSSSDYFEALAAVENDVLVSTTPQDDMMNKQIVPVASSKKGVQGNEVVAKEMSVRRSVSKSNLVEEKKDNAHSSITPTFHFSSPHVEKIIYDTHAAMLTHTNLVKQPLVTLNISVFEVPTQSMESCGEHGDEFGQLMTSIGNTNEVIRVNVREMAIKSKLWRDQ